MNHKTLRSCNANFDMKQRQEKVGLSKYKTTGIEHVVRIARVNIGF